MTQPDSQFPVSDAANLIWDGRYQQGWDGLRVGSPKVARTKSVLVVGIGNVLRRDDGFGPAVIQTLEKTPGLPPDVHLMEVGIGGLGLVLELIDGYDTLVIVDAVDRGGRPGTLYLLEPVVPDLAALTNRHSPDLGTDMHQVGPGKALIMARALGVLPKTVRIIGCQPGETDEFSLELSQPVEESVRKAVQMILEFLKSRSKR